MLGAAGSSKDVAIDGSVVKGTDATVVYTRMTTADLLITQSLNVEMFIDGFIM